MTDDEKKLAAANPRPCSACPWRESNQGTPHPHGWYTQKNLVRLWSKLRRGESMSCHPTDPRNEVPEGCKPVPEDATTHECTGALILQQREFMNLQDVCRALPSDSREGIRIYQGLNPKGLTRHGIGTILNRAIFGGALREGVPMSQPNLNEDGISAPGLTWEPRKS